MEFLRLNKKALPKKATVITGFTGFGNVGYRVITHLVETMELESIGYWGMTSWYYKNRIESIFTVYKSVKKPLIIVAPRVLIPVTASHPSLWDQLSRDILNIPAQRYIVIGGLREITRPKGDSSWAAYVVTPQYQNTYHKETTFGEKLAMIGPLSNLITNGSAMGKAVMGLLMYCNDEDDIEASQLALREINQLLDLELPQDIPLQEFDYSFIPSLQLKRDLNQYEDYDDELDDDEDLGKEEGDLGFDMDDLR